LRPEVVLMNLARVQLALCGAVFTVVAVPFTEACGGRAELFDDNQGDAAFEDGPEVDGVSPGDDTGTTSHGDSGIVIGDTGVGPGLDASRPIDASRPDTGAPTDSSTGLPDSSRPDTGTLDSSLPDTGVHDSAGPDVVGPPDVLSCAVGFHVCSGECVDDTAPATCGTSCTPCPAPANGVASCDGTSCAVTCDPGFVTCSTGCCSCGNVQTDPNNCGYCGHSCGAEACVDGVCGSTVVATDQANAFAIAADDVNVYWSTTGNASSVVQQPIAGGGETILWSSPNDYPASLALLDGQVYFTDEIFPGSVSRVPIGGGALIPVAPNLNYPGALCVNGSTLYFTSYDAMGNGLVLSVPASGGSSQTLASNQEFFTQTPSIATGGSNVFWTSYNGLEYTPLGGGSIKTIATPPPNLPNVVVADATRVYWGAGTNGGVVLQQTVGGTTAITIATDQYYPDAIAVDSTSIYWTTGAGGAGTVMKSPIGGGTPVTLAVNQAYPAGIALNSTTVFWVNFGDGSIHSVPK
jgi:hypothetical protein